MNRREFLQIVGASAGAVAFSPVLNLADSLALAASSPKFTIYGTPSFNLEVFGAKNKSYGTVSGNTFAPTVKTLKAKGIDGYCASSTVCKVPQGATQEDVNKRLSLPNIRNTIPQPLQPLFDHPIDALTKRGSDSSIVKINEALFKKYTLEGVVIPRADPGAVLKVKDVVPIEDQKGLSAAAANADVTGSIGNYFWKVKLESHFIAGCIKRDLWHAEIVIRYIPTGRYIVNLCLASWWEGLSSCYAAYDTRSKRCWKICTWDAYHAYYAIAAAVGGSRMRWWLASALAAAIAAPTVALLVAIPGSPPPP